MKCFCFVVIYIVIYNISGTRQDNEKAFAEVSNSIVKRPNRSPEVARNIEDVQTLHDVLTQHGHQQENTIKEKRCHDTDFLVGAALNPLALPALSLKRRDAQKEFYKKQCETCRATSLCKNGNLCALCDTICNQSKDKPLTIKTRSMIPFEENANKNIVGVAPALQQRSAFDNGLSQDQDRYYTVGSFGVGPKQTLLARLLGIPTHIPLERLIILAKNKSKSKTLVLPHPVVIDTAHVFTTNDGKPAQLDVEIHKVNTKNEEDIDDLTTKLNKELDSAIETKKQMLGDSHLTPDEIDKIIDHAVATHTKQRTMASPVVGSAPSSDVMEAAEEDTLGKKFKGHKGGKKHLDGEEDNQDIETLANEDMLGKKFKGHKGGKKHLNDGENVDEGDVLGEVNNEEIQSMAANEPAEEPNTHDIVGHKHKGKKGGKKHIDGEDIEDNNNQHVGSSLEEYYTASKELKDAKKVVKTVETTTEAVEFKTLAEKILPAKTANQRTNIPAFDDNHLENKDAINRNAQNYNAESAIGHGEQYNPSYNQEESAYSAPNNGGAPKYYAPPTYAQSQPNYEEEKAYEPQIYHSLPTKSQAAPSSDSQYADNSPVYEQGQAQYKKPSYNAPAVQPQEYGQSQAAYEPTANVYNQQGNPEAYQAPQTTYDEGVAPQSYGPSVPSYSAPVPQGSGAYGGDTKGAQSYESPAPQGAQSYESPAPQGESYNGGAQEGYEADSPSYANGVPQGPYDAPPQQTYDEAMPPQSYEGTGPQSYQETGPYGGPSQVYNSPADMYAQSNAGNAYLQPSAPSYGQSNGASAYPSEVNDEDLPYGGSNPIYNEEAPGNYVGNAQDANLLGDTGITNNEDHASTNGAIDDDTDDVLGHKHKKMKGKKGKGGGGGYGYQYRNGEEEEVLGDVAPEVVSHAAITGEVNDDTDDILEHKHKKSKGKKGGKGGGYGYQYRNEDDEGLVGEAAPENEAPENLHHLQSGEVNVHNDDILEHKHKKSKGKKGGKGGGGYGGYGYRNGEEGDDNDDVNVQSENHDENHKGETLDENEGDNMLGHKKFKGHKKGKGGGGGYQYRNGENDDVLGQANMDQAGIETNDNTNDFNKAKDPVVGENWFEEQYHRLRNWVSENVGMENPKNETDSENHKEMLNKLQAILENDKLGSALQKEQISETFKTDDANKKNNVKSLANDEEVGCSESEEYYREAGHDAPRKHEHKEGELSHDNDHVVKLENMNEFKTRFQPDAIKEIEKTKEQQEPIVGDAMVHPNDFKMHPRMQSVYQNGEYKSMKQPPNKPPYDTKHGLVGDAWKKIDVLEDAPIANEVANKVVQAETKIPPINTRPFVDSKLLDLKSIVKDLGRDIQKVPNYVLNEADKIKDVLRPKNLGVLNHDAAAVPTLMQRSQVDSDKDSIKEPLENVGAVQEDKLDAKNETVGCSLEESSEEMYLTPYNGYGKSAGQKEEHKKTWLDKLMHPKEKSAKANGEHAMRKHHEHATLIPPLPEIIKNLEKMTLPPMPTIHHHKSTTPLPVVPAIKINGQDYNEADQAEGIQPNIQNDPINNKNLIVPPQNMQQNYPQQFNQPQQQNNEFRPPNPRFPMRMNNENGFMNNGFQNEQSRFANNGFPNDQSAFQNAPNQQQADLLGAAPQEQYAVNHFGKIVPSHLSMHNRDVSEQEKGKKVIFVGSGINLPLHMKEHDDGTLHLSVDVDKLCKCNSTNSCNKTKEEPHFLETQMVGASNGNAELNVDDASVDIGDAPLAMGTPDFDKLRSEMDDGEKKAAVHKRSPRFDYTSGKSDSGELVEVFKDNENRKLYDEKYDNVLPINHEYRNMYNNKDYLQSYEPRNEIPNERQMDDVRQRVGLLTNVLSWMKDLAIDADHTD